jgi:hypothetical protein
LGSPAAAAPGPTCAASSFSRLRGLLRHEPLLVGKGAPGQWRRGRIPGGPSSSASGSYCGGARCADSGGSRRLSTYCPSCWTWPSWRRRQPDTHDLGGRPWPGVFLGPPWHRPWEANDGARPCQPVTRSGLALVLALTIWPSGVPNTSSSPATALVAMWRGAWRPAQRRSGRRGLRFVNWPASLSASWPARDSTTPLPTLPRSAGSPTEPTRSRRPDLFPPWFRSPDPAGSSWKSAAVAATEVELERFLSSCSVLELVPICSCFSAKRWLDWLLYLVKLPLLLSLNLLLLSSFSWFLCRQLSSSCFASSEWVKKYTI